jgi:hypothetical protein
VCKFPWGRARAICNYTRLDTGLRIFEASQTVNAASFEQLLDVGLVNDAGEAVVLKRVALAVDAVHTVRALAGRSLVRARVMTH